MDHSYPEASQRDAFSQPMEPFYCKSPSTRVLHSLLSSLSALSANSASTLNSVAKRARFNRNCSVYVSPADITFVVAGLVKTSQASVNIQAELFSSYNLPGDEATRGHDFSLDIDVLLTSLSTLGGERDNITCEITYDPESKIFKTALKDRNGAVSETAIQTICDDSSNDDDTYLQTTFMSSQVVSRAIIKSSILKSTFAEIMRVPGSTSVELTMSPHSVTLSTTGDGSALHADLPRSRAIFSSLEANPPTSHARSYSRAYLSDGMRGCDVAFETCVQMNSCGVLAVQHQVLDNEGRPSFVDFILAPLRDEDDEDDAESGGGVGLTLESGEKDDGGDTDEEEGFRRGSGGKRTGRNAFNAGALAAQALLDDDSETEDEGF